METLFSIFKPVLILAVSIGAYVLAVVVVVSAPVASSNKDSQFSQFAQLLPDPETDIAHKKNRAINALTGKGTPVFGPKISRAKICSSIEE